MASSSEESREKESDQPLTPDAWPGRLGMLKMIAQGTLHAPITGIRSAIRRFRHGSLYDHIYQYVQEHAEEGNPASVVETLDRFAIEQVVTMFIGDSKGPIVRKIVEQTKPMVCVELGSFIGYSAIDAARLLPEGGKYYCIEPNDESLDLLRKLVNYAGLQEKIHVIHGYSTEVIPRLKGEFGIEAADYVLIDHDRRFYKSDLVLLEDQGLLKPGTVVVADNVVMWHIVGFDYLDYVRNSPKFKSEFFIGEVGYSLHVTDGIEKSTFLGQNPGND